MPRGAGLLFVTGRYTSQQLLPDLAVGSFEHIPDFLQAGWDILRLAPGIMAGGWQPRPGEVYYPLIDGAGNDTVVIRNALDWAIAQWQAGRKLFICCRRGANRSPSIIAGVLFLTGRTDRLIDAIEAIRLVRPETNANTPRMLADVQLLLSGAA